MLAASLVLSLACGTAGGRSDPQTTPPTVASGARDAGAPEPAEPPDASGDAAAEAVTAPGPCEPEMFGGTPGAAGLFAFQDDRERYGFRDAEGRVRIAARFLHAYEFFAEGVTGAVDETATFVFIDTTGRVIARAYPIDNGPDYFVEGRARIVANAKIGFIDRSGRIVVPPRYEFASSFCHGLAVVCSRCWRARGPRGERYEGGKWGYLDKTGAVAIPLEFDAATDFDEGRARVVRRGKELTIDTTGRPIEP